MGVLWKTWRSYLLSARSSVIDTDPNLHDLAGSIDCWLLQEEQFLAASFAMASGYYENAVAPYSENGEGYVKAEALARVSRIICILSFLFPSCMYPIPQGFGCCSSTFNTMRQASVFAVASQATLGKRNILYHFSLFLYSVETPHPYTIALITPSTKEQSAFVCSKSISIIHSKVR